MGNVGTGFAQVAEAERVCRACEVREACLTWALDVHVEDGVFGGLDAAERRAVLKTDARLR